MTVLSDVARPTGITGRGPERIKDRRKPTMKRLLPLLLTLLIALPVVAALTACGPDNDEPRPRIPQNRLKPNRPVKSLSPEEAEARTAQTQAQLVSRLKWSDPSSEPGDAAADASACVEQAESDPRVANANPLVRLTWLASCLKEKGWEIDLEE
jgi:hypothetical protein